MRSAALDSLILSAFLMATASVYGQGVAPPADRSGTDVSGTWIYGGHQDSGYGTAAGALVDYGGIPLSEAGRLYALSWDASRMTVRQQQCAGYGIPYAYFSPGNYRYWEERDPHTQELVAIHMYFQTSEVNRTIWMDGRPHPPAYAAHTFAGYSTGKWEGNILGIHTTHLKRAWLRGNGTPTSDEAEVYEYLIRHGDRLTVFTVSVDPVFLDEPYSKTMINLRNIKDPVAWLYACDDGEEILARSEEKIPSYFFGKNPFLNEYAKRNKVPMLGTLGGGMTMHPEFAAKLKDPAAADAQAMAETVPSGSPQERVSKVLEQIPNDNEIHVLPVQGSVYMLAGDSGNIAVQVGDEGAFVVDTGAGKLSSKVIEAIKKLSARPVQFIANTSFHADHTGGNVQVRAAGRDPSVQGSFFSNQFADAGVGATIISQQNVQNRMTAMKTPADGWPSDTFLKDRRRKFHNGELIEIFYQPNAITDGDSIVHFRRSDVIATGDIYDATRYPFIDVKNGGSIQGEINALNNILDKTGYQHDEDGGTMIIPGHGRLSDEYDVSEYRDMLSIIRDRIQAMIHSGASLDQVLAARLTADYDPRFGSNTGAWTTNMFVEAVYATITKPAGVAHK